MQCHSWLKYLQETAFSKFFWMLYLETILDVGHGLRSGTRKLYSCHKYIDVGFRKHSISGQNVSVDECVVYLKGNNFS